MKRYCLCSVGEHAESVILLILCYLLCYNTVGTHDSPSSHHHPGGNCVTHKGYLFFSHLLAISQHHIFSPTTKSLNVSSAFSFFLLLSFCFSFVLFELSLRGDEGPKRAKRRRKGVKWWGEDGKGVKA